MLAVSARGFCEIHTQIVHINCSGRQHRNVAGGPTLNCNTTYGLHCANVIILATALIRLIVLPMFGKQMQARIMFHFGPARILLQNEKVLILVNVQLVPSH